MAVVRHNEKGDSSLRIDPHKMGLRGPITICVAFFGQHPDLCRRFLTHLYRFTPAASFSLRVGLNAVCPETLDLVQSAARQFGNIWIHSEPHNIYKSPLMAKLFSERPIESEWIVWFDDDSYPYRSDWLPGLKLKIQSQPEIDVWGNPFFTDADDAAINFIQSAAWYRGKPFDHVQPNGEWNERPILTFVEGGFWAAKTKVLQALHWPDPRLVQNEDDYIFGEALRQNGYRIGKYKSGIRISQAERRCPRDTPSSYGQPTQLAAAP